VLWRGAGTRFQSSQDGDFGGLCKFGWHVFAELERREWRMLPHAARLRRGCCGLDWLGWFDYMLLVLRIVEVPAEEAHSSFIHRCWTVRRAEECIADVPSKFPSCSMKVASRWKTFMASV
jgi:hypothetical protein